MLAELQQRRRGRDRWRKVVVPYSGRSHRRVARPTPPTSTACFYVRVLLHVFKLSLISTVTSSVRRPKGDWSRLDPPSSKSATVHRNKLLHSNGSIGPHRSRHSRQPPFDLSIFRNGGRPPSLSLIFVLFIYVFCSKQENRGPIY